MTAYYDLAYAPLTFDFCHYLVAAVSYARMLNRPSIDLVVIADAYRQWSEREKSYSTADRRWRMWNLIVEIAKVAPQIQNVSILRRPPDPYAANAYPPTYRPPNQHEIPYNVRTVRNFFEEGLDVRIFRPSAYALRAVDRMMPRDAGKIVTLTMRKAGHDAHRDSRMDVWHRFAQVLKSRGYFPVIVPDQDDVLSDRTISQLDWFVVEAAAMSADLRLALYHRSSMNYVTNNGIIGLLMYSTAPIAWFSVIVEGSPVADIEYYRRQGLEIGEKHPWFDDNQHMFWERETLENLTQSISLIR